MGTLVFSINKMLNHKLDFKVQIYWSKMEWYQHRIKEEVAANLILNLRKIMDNNKTRFSNYKMLKIIKSLAIYKPHKVLKNQIRFKQPLMITLTKIFNNR